MLKIFWIGSPFFQASINSPDIKMHFFNFEHFAVFYYDDLVRMAGFEPDVVVVGDKSRPPFVLGVEDFPCLTVCYVVDSHIHSWFPYYAQAFDACLVSLKDHIPLFYNKALSKDRIFWMPPFAMDTDMPTQQQLSCMDAAFAKEDCSSLKYTWDCLFVGTVNALTTPARKVFFEKLQEYIPVQVMSGDYAQLYTQGKVILNFCEFGDLNFRVFEALACGTALIPPTVQHGFADLFTDEKDLMCYDTSNIQDLVDKVLFLQNNEQKRLELIRNGFAKVDKAHRAKHRAEQFVNILRMLTGEQKELCIQKRLENAHNIRNKWLKAPYLLLADSKPMPEAFRSAYLLAATGKNP